MSRALTAANVAAVTLFIGFSVARHAPLEIFPAAWRKMLIRWRKAHSQRASSNAAQDSASVVSLGRAHPYDTAAGEATFKAWPAFNGDTKLAHTAGITRRQRLEVRPPLDSLFAGTSLRCRLSYALAERRALDRKEVSSKPFLEADYLLHPLRSLRHRTASHLFAVLRDVRIHGAGSGVVTMWPRLPDLRRMRGRTWPPRHPARRVGAGSL